MYEGSTAFEVVGRPQMGALAAIAPSTTLAYLMRNHAASIPPYLLTKKKRKSFRVGIYPDFVWLTTSTMHPHGAHAQGGKRNRIDRRGGEIERLAARTSRRRR